MVTFGVLMVLAFSSQMVLCHRRRHHSEEEFDSKAHYRLDTDTGSSDLDNHSISRSLKILKILMHQKHRELKLLQHMKRRLEDNQNREEDFLYL